MKGLISYALAFAGLGTVIAAIAATFVGNVKYMYARALLINMLRTNPYRAELLCSRSTGTFMDAIGAALKTAAMTGSRDPKIIAAATVPSYDAAGMMVGIRFGKIITKAKLGLMMAAGGFVLAVFGGAVPIFLLIIALLAGGGFVFLLARKQEAEQSIVRARLEVLPEVDRAFIDGRYVKQ